jgi:hypothetical protein
LGLEDLVSTESAFVAATTAAVFSPRTRETLRRGAVLGVAGALKVGDVVAGAARGATRGVRGGETVSTPAASGNAGPTQSASTARNRRSSPRSSRGASSPSASGSSR